MARTRTSAAPPLPEPSFEPRDPVLRTLNRVKGEGRRRLLLGHALELTGEVEAARVIWSLPLDEARSGSLPRDAGLFRSACEEAIAVGRENEADGSENVEEAGGVAAAEGGALAAKGAAGAREPSGAGSQASLPQAPRRASGVTPMSLAIWRERTGDRSRPEWNGMVVWRPSWWRYWRWEPRWRRSARPRHSRSLSTSRGLSTGSATTVTRPEPCRRPRARTRASGLRLREAAR